VAVWFAGSSKFFGGGNSFAVSFILVMILGDDHVGIEDVIISGVMGVCGDVAFHFCLPLQFFEKVSLLLVLVESLSSF